MFAGDPVMVGAALDRLLHRCTVVNIRGDSYRLKEKRQAGMPVALVETTTHASAMGKAAQNGVSATRKSKREEVK